MAVGLTLLGIWGAARLHRSVASHEALKAFKANAGVKTSCESPVDFTLWSPQRIAAYKDSLTAKRDLPLAILRIPKINLEVPVFNDTDDLTLNRGVGRIVGTARIGEPATSVSRGTEMDFSAASRMWPVKIMSNSPARDVPMNTSSPESRLSAPKMFTF